MVKNDRLCVVARSLLVGLLPAVGSAPILAQQPAPPPGGVVPAAMPGRQADPPAVMLTMENQFDQKTNLADLRGSVVILVYGDRKGTEACRALGEQLHVSWHPDAKGLAPGPAQKAAVVPLGGVALSQPQPDVRVVPVACCGKVPGPVRGAIRAQIAKGAPEVPVWLDFADTMKSAFGLTGGEPNMVVFDAAGRLRMKVNGTPDQATLNRLVQVVQNLRYDAVK